MNEASSTSSRTRTIAAAVLAASLLGSASTACTTSHADPDTTTTTATVLRIVDGDTVDVVDDTRGRIRLRLLGIDTPETKKPGYSVGCWGPQATEFARESLAGQRVSVITDSTQDLHDRYGRTLAYLDKPGNWDYSVEAARAGARPGLRLRVLPRGTRTADRGRRRRSQAGRPRAVGAAVQRPHRISSGEVRLWPPAATVSRRGPTGRGVTTGAAVASRAAHLRRTRLRRDS